MSIDNTAFATASVSVADATASAFNAADSAWVHICALDDIVPNTGVCALLDGHQVAVFRVVAAPSEMAPKMAEDDSMIFAIGNYDPQANAAVLSRGLIGNLGDRLVVASPIYKQHFDLRTGACLEAPEHAVPCFDARVRDGEVWVLGTPVADGAVAAAADGAAR